MSAPRKVKTKYAVPELGRLPNRRPTRVAEASRGELSMLLLQKVKDQRLTEVTITKVEVTPDMRSAFVYFNCPEGAIKLAEAGLARSRGFMRSHLAKALELRYMPELLFKYDLSAVRQAEMDRILREIGNELHAPARDTQGDPES